MDVFSSYRWKIENKEKPFCLRCNDFKFAVCVFTSSIYALILFVRSFSSVTPYKFNTGISVPPITRTANSSCGLLPVYCTYNAPPRSTSVDVNSGMVTSFLPVFNVATT